MKLLHVITALGVGGVERLLLSLARARAAEGRTPFEIAYLKGAGELRAAFEACGVRVHALEAPHLHGLPAAARRLRRLARERRIDLVHSHLLQGDFTAVRALRGALPHLRAQHNVERALQRASVRWIYRRALAGRTPLLVPTTCVREFLIERCGEPRELVSVVPYGLASTRTEDEARWQRERAPRRAAWSVGARERVALVLARLAPQKGQRALLRALRSQPPAAEWILVFAGAASSAREQRALEAELADHPWRARIRMVGPSPEPELCLRSADALAVPSLWEGFGLVALEALQAGTPVIAHDLPVLREVLGASARFVAMLDGAAWCAALRELADADPRCAERVRSGRARAAEHFALARLEESLEHHYAALLRDEHSAT
ncbi:MAG: glycosyltransferase family 4 protein [Planctomycetes bacterium]|nr:glycosyltransferase family 4 protein [Planctomycetota bacterium]